MRELTYRQLQKCVNIDTSKIDKDSTKIILSRKTDVPILEGKCYIIQLDESLLNMSQSDILVCNWNAGSVPGNNSYKCEVTKRMANMIKINGLAYNLEQDLDLNRMWTGWLPVDKVKVIKEI